MNRKEKFVEVKVKTQDRLLRKNSRDMIDTDVAKRLPDYYINFVVDFCPAECNINNATKSFTELHPKNLVGFSEPWF